MKNLFFLSLSLFAFKITVAEPKSVRWTYKDDKNAEIHHVLTKIKGLTGIELSANQFMIVEDRNLATSHYTMLAQLAGGLPRRGLSIRIWTSLKTGEAIQVEARVESAAPKNLTAQLNFVGRLSSEQTMQVVRTALAKHEDRFMKDVTYTNEWHDHDLVRVVTVKARRGTHTINILMPTQKVLSQTYKEYPTSEEFSIPVQIYPIYEEVEGAPGKTLPRTASSLRYLKTSALRGGTNPFAELQTQRYLYDKYDPLLGLTVEGRKNGFWAMSYIKMLASEIQSKMSKTPNNFTEGVILQGRYATVNLHPAVAQNFNLKFTPVASAQFLPMWQEVAEGWEMIPSSAILGKPIMSLEEAWNRPAHRLANHDTATYINDGFDEMQVYWSINQMFESLGSMGFTDPELSTRPFHAYLYDPDISMRDNAYYTDDTINFTTYSPTQQNMARDNSTIWHELGHGVMDRLMGDYIRLADTGGLSEGMADFVAQMILNDITGGQNFEGREQLRIFNKTGFGLTNEVHDDGESYGGAMNDLMLNAIAQYGKPGISKVTDLTLEAMRLTRNHPGLTANDWFDHMIFADEIGNAPLRNAGELKQIILTSLAGRNFNMDGAPTAKFVLKNGAEEVTSTGLGSRENPIRLNLAATETATYNLNVSLVSTPTYQFKYPVTVKVQLRNGPIQGAVHWNGEENQPWVYTLNSEADSVPITLTATGTCDYVNNPDGSCKDFAYIHIYNAGETQKPQAKKRFYLRITPK